MPHEEITDAVLDIEEELYRQLVDNERDAVAWTLQQTGPECQPGKVLAGCLEPLVERLPEPYLDAVTLTELNGLNQKEAADELGVSLSGMKSRIQRGRGKLKDLLLDCCKIEVDRRGAVIDYERRNEGTCGGCNCE